VECCRDSCVVGIQELTQVCLAMGLEDVLLELFEVCIVT